MSVYDRRYEVFNGHSSYYTDDPAEALAHYRRGDHPTKPKWINEGYGDVGYQDEHVTEVIRRTTRQVLPSTLEYQIERAKVRELILGLNN